jgi:hypothetical protein
MKTTLLKVLSAFLIACLPILSFAQKDTISTSAKIDSIYKLQRKMYSEVKRSPLEHKTFGIELNPFRLLVIDKMSTISGGVSFFAINRNAEVAFPFYFQFPQESSDLTDYTLDCHYRYFLGNTQNGFYVSTFLRYAYLYGVLGDDYLIDDRTLSDRKGEQNKLGFGFGLGVRIFSYKGLYWGASLNFGRYFVGKNNQFKSNVLAFDDDNEYILDVELLKFGWAF